MRILFASNNTFIPQGIGGFEKSTHELCIALIRKGIQTAVLAGLSNGDVLWLRNRLFSKIFRTGKCPVDFVNKYPVYRGWDTLNGLHEVIGHFKPSVVIVQQEEAMKLANILLSANIPTVIYIRDTDFNRLGGNLKNNKYLMVLANSSYIASRIYSAFNVIAKVLHPLVIPENYKIATTKKNVLFINPIPLKGLKIALYLAAKRPDVKFVFVESWRYKKNIMKSLIEKTRHIHNITWLQSRLDVRTLYKNAKLVLVPSQLEEAWGRVVSEAHLNGIPVLASNIGGLPESVGPGGILVQRDAPLENWLRSFSDIWDNQKNYEVLSRAALNYSYRLEIQPKYIINKIVNELNDHINKCNEFNSK